MQELKVSDIRIDGNTQVREKLNQDRVNSYAEQMNDGAVFPPITVFFDGSSYWLADGFHRLFAEKQRGTEIVKVTVINGAIHEAEHFACGANNHGLNMTPEDYRRAIIKTLKNPISKDYSNIQIANHVGTSASTVARVKKEQNIKPADKVKYTDKHGNEATMDTSKIGKKPAKPAKPEPKAEKEQDEYDPAEEKMRELMDTITNLSDENTVLRDKIAIGQWDASEIEKIDAQETIENLREQIRILEIDNQALRESRDMFQNRNAELIKSVNSLKKKLQKGA
jgi:ParB-like chromosome segregation protein Spo0J